MRWWVPLETPFVNQAPSLGTPGVISVYKNKLTDGFTSCFQIKDLKEGVSYVFRVRAQNKAGVGKASEETEPVLAETKPGTIQEEVSLFGPQNDLWTYHFQMLGCIIHYWYNVTRKPSNKTKARSLDLSWYLHCSTEETLVNLEDSTC